ncbi:HNH endonuclease [uncultured Ilyobacter sp.]|uniref:HNH endonuclease n=1 Tax=uncultured Ilyobacter sp. TaxID=544433 RepID=UPI0029F5128B|nr:HNH endonuclease [uncultured Ilyobacter sp.]
MINIIFFWIAVFIIIFIFTRKSKSTYGNKKDENIQDSEKITFDNLKRKEIKVFFDDKLTESEKIKLHDIFEERCFKCKSTEHLSIDHHIPISKGYPLKDKEAGLNAVVLCEKCNRQKGDIPPEKYYTKEELIKLENLGVKSHLYYTSKRLKFLEKRLLSGKIKFLEKSAANKDKIKFVYLDQRDPLFVREKVEVLPLRVVSRKTFLYRGWTREWFLYSAEDNRRIFNIRWIYHLEKSFK